MDFRNACSEGTSGYEGSTIVHGRAELSLASALARSPYGREGRQPHRYRFELSQTRCHLDMPNYQQEIPRAQTLLKLAYSGTEEVALHFRENGAGIQALADASADLWENWVRGRHQSR